MTEVTNEQLELSENDKVFLLVLAGGMGARIVQTTFIRSLIRKRKSLGVDYPILVIDNTLIGHMVSEALKGQNVRGIQIAETQMQWPNDPGYITLENGIQEHPMFVESWRKNFQQYSAQSGSMHRLLKNNMKRAYSVEYGFSLSKLIELQTHNKSKKSFIANLYSKCMQPDGLEYDGGVPMLKRTQHNEEVESFVNSIGKPYVLLHLGEDRNPQEFMSPVNYRLHKVWSNERWAQLVDSLKHKYEFVQVYANQFNPEIPGVKTVKVDNLNPVLQLLENPKCAFFMSIDNYLPHLAASINKRGIVLWGSCSPNVWGWDHNINIWNTHSCPIIGCWRPGQFDHDQNGKLFVCDHYSCMRSIEVDQVMDEVNNLEKSIVNTEVQEMITL
jgi:ADP-heptose:LPS heptosyltransferase